MYLQRYTLDAVCVFFFLVMVLRILPAGVVVMTAMMVGGGGGGGGGAGIERAAYRHDNFSLMRGWSRLNFTKQTEASQRRPVGTTVVSRGVRFEKARRRSTGMSSNGSFLL